MGASLPWNPWTHFPTALRELAKVATNPLVSCWGSGFIGKLNKSSHTPPHYPSSWANSRISRGMLWCALCHHGPQVVHHDILSRWWPSSFLLAHRVGFVCTTIIHFTNGSGTWLHFECFASPPWQMHPGGLLVELPFEVPSLTHFQLFEGFKSESKYKTTEGEESRHAP